MKLIINIPEQGVNACKLWVEMGVASWQDKVIAKGIPYEDKPHGKWLELDDEKCGGTTVYCPFCGATPHKQYKNFCPNCGADMRKGEI